MQTWCSTDESVIAEDNRDICVNSAVSLVSKSIVICWILLGQYKRNALGVDDAVRHDCTCADLSLRGQGKSVNVF